MTSQSTPEFTVFISHAGEDKATIAIPLREKLRSHGITAFVDEADMPAGTDAERAMIAAMEAATLAVVVLSPEFVARKWPMKELFCFLRRREESAKRGDSPQPITIPFFYRLGIAELYGEPRLDRLDSEGKSLYLRSRFLERMNSCEPEADINRIKKALKKIHGIMGIRNDLDATNDSSYVMFERRELLLQKLCKKVMQAIPQESANRRPAPSAPYYSKDEDERADLEGARTRPGASHAPRDRKEQDDAAEKFRKANVRIDQLNAEAGLILKRMGR